MQNANPRDGTRFILVVTLCDGVGDIRVRWLWTVPRFLSSTSTSVALWFSSKTPSSGQQGPDDSCIHAASPLCCSAEINIHSSSTSTSTSTMWNKLTNVLKTRSDVDVPSPNAPFHPSRGTKSLDLQRTLPSLPPHDFDSPKPLPAPSPPSSPSKYGRLGLFRRSSKSTGPGSLDNSSSVSLAKKVKASLNINTNFNGAFYNYPSHSASDTSMKCLMCQLLLQTIPTVQGCFPCRMRNCHPFHPVRFGRPYNRDQPLLHWI